MPRCQGSTRQHPIGTTGRVKLCLYCSICSGSGRSPGIYIQSVRQDGLAAEAGLEVGDQILAVNGTEFTGITHSQAVVALKGSRQLNITVNKYAVSTPISISQVHRKVHGRYTDKKKILLRERKRHTDRSVSSTPYAVLKGGRAR